MEDLVARLEALELEQRQLRDQNQQLQAQLAQRRRSEAETGARVLLQVQGPIDTRVMSKPENFSGKEEDWNSFAMGVKAFAGALSPRMLELLKRAEKPAESIDRVDLDPGDEVLDSQLYYILIMLVKGVKADMIELVEAGEGLAIWRRLHSEHEPKLKARSLSHQQKVLGFKMEASDISSEIDRLERLCKLYKQVSGHVMDDETKQGVLLAALTK